MKTLLPFLLLCGLATFGFAAGEDAQSKVSVEALIDGPSEPRIKKDGIYWINGENAKPGMHQGQEEPTYVNGKSWRPNWKNSRATRGVDKSATKNVEGIDPAKLEFRLVSVTLTKDGTGIDKRDPVRVTTVRDEMSIMIPDSQSGPRWYRFELIQKP